MGESPCGVWKPRLYSRKRIRRGGFTGRRNADTDILKNAKRCGKILAESGVVTLNGLAVGCDTAWLEGALAAGGKCIAVMPCGLDYIYPKCNASLVESILKNGGCIVSEYGPGERPEKWKFVKRDLLQAMIVDKILVVDSDCSAQINLAGSQKRTG